MATTASLTHGTPPSAAGTPTETKPAITAVAAHPTRVASPTRTPRAATNHGHGGAPAVRAPTKVPAMSSGTSTTDRRQPALIEWTRLNAATSTAEESSVGSPNGSIAATGRPTARTSTTVAPRRRLPNVGVVV